MAFRLVLALDWTPNTNHVGFYVSKALGYYNDEGIELVIESPSDSYNNEETPARRVVNGTADLCVAPTESVISCYLSRDDNKLKPIAIACILQTDTSAIVTNNADIKTPRDLSNKKYASYAGRFEMNIVNELVKKDGGSEVIEVLPPKLDCFDAMLRGEADGNYRITIIIIITFIIIIIIISYVDLPGLGGDSSQSSKHFAQQIRITIIWIFTCFA